MKHPDTRHLLILRHGKARTDLPVSDRERPLTDDGRADIRRMARAVLKAGRLPDLVLCSPAVRTRETAEVFLAAAHVDPDVAFIDSIYDGSSGDLLRLVAGAPAHVRCLMLVGHNPDIEDLAHQLCGDRSNGLGMHPGALALFEITGTWREISAKTAIFMELIDPRA